LHLVYKYLFFNYKYCITLYNLASRATINLIRKAVLPDGVTMPANREYSVKKQIFVVRIVIAVPLHTANCVQPVMINVKILQRKSVGYALNHPMYVMAVANSINVH
jgi:hypothetical protein